MRMSVSHLSGTFLATGSAAGIILIAFLAVTRLLPAFRFWPTPRRWGWQGVVFWSLFRLLNVSALLLALLDWQPWRGVSPDRLGGAAVAISGATLYLMACHALGRGNLYCGREGLVTRGIYRWTRNPQYATAIPAYLGLALASQSVGALALAVMLSAVFLLMALAEEPWLEGAYGEEYRAYCRQVARFYNWRHGMAVARTEISRLERALKEARLG
jgi:protein-S-isoprenylcysteine O-methyltransferase Ste14